MERKERQNELHGPSHSNIDLWSGKRGRTNYMVHRIASKAADKERKAEAE